MKSAFARWSIAAVLGAGAVAVVLEPAKDNRPQPPVREAVVEEKRPDFAEQLRRAALSRELDAQPFAPVDWKAHQPASPASAAKPSIAQFSFRFAGHLQEGGRARSFYLARGNDIFPIALGDLLEGFRIDGVHDDRIDVTFLSSGERLSLLLSSLGGAEKTAVPPSTREQAVNSTSEHVSIPHSELIADVATPEAHSGPTGRSDETGGGLGTNPISSARLGTNALGSGRLGL